ncbi:hypothetical protein V6C21_09765, partial [[Clostridium] cellulosi]
MSITILKKYANQEFFSIGGNHIEFFPLTATLMASTIFSLSVSSSIVEAVQNKPVFSNLLTHLHT